MNERNESWLRRDRMRFIKNKQSANLAILAIVFDVLYFVRLYQSDVGSYYYNILIGASVVYNLIFMLAAFLSSEGVKNYKKSYTWLLIALGVMQVARVFVIPARSRGATVSVGGMEVAVMGEGAFLFLAICLVLSAACLIASGLINLVKCNALEAHNKELAEEARASAGQAR